jgi:hypothetical protein
MSPSHPFLFYHPSFLPRPRASTRHSQTDAVARPHLSTYTLISSLQVLFDMIFPEHPCCPIQGDVRRFDPVDGERQPWICMRTSVAYSVPSRDGDTYI